MTTYFNVFVRSWWKINPAWPGGREPQAGTKSYLRRHVTEADARELCEEYNRTHEPGPTSIKAEYEEA